MVYRIGIDTGTITGYAIMKDGKLIRIGQGGIHEAMDMVRAIMMTAVSLHVVVEDARLRKWFGNNSEAKKQGAGSIKRDCKIWDDYLKWLEVSYEMKHPIRGGTKLTPEMFERLTGFKTKKGESHARDAAMLII